MELEVPNGNSPLVVLGGSWPSEKQEKLVFLGSTRSPVRQTELRPGNKVQILDSKIAI